MAGGARVMSVEALDRFRSAVSKFGEAASAALAECDSEAERAMQWLTHEQLAHWQREVRKRQERVAQAKSAVYRKELTALPERARAFEERDALDAAKRGLEEAERKVEAVKKWARVLDREFALYRGASQTMQDVVAREMPGAMSRLGKMIEHLQAYAMVSKGTGGTAAASTESGGQGVQASDHARLRRRTPSDEARMRAVKSGEAGVVGRIALVIDAIEGGLLARLGLGGEAIQPGLLAVVSAGSLDGRDVYFERRCPACPEDSGWFVGSMVADSEAGVYETITLGDLVRLVPRSSEVLELPEGWVCVVVSGGVAAVLDVHNRDLLAGR
ncbi:MAG: hypothetical protein KF745_04165 [Phycisphaeraceae bacterium]|nr:hypothetical protein [Phycisphaeraceae bacterium]